MRIGSICISADEDTSSQVMPTVDPKTKETIRQVVAHHREGIHLGDIDETYLVNMIIMKL